MRSYAQILTTLTADTPGTTVLLHFDHKRYLLGNVAEGTQRACTELGARLVKVSDIFLTGQLQWSTTGGLFGMILSLADLTQAAKLSEMEQNAAKADRAAQRIAEQHKRQAAAIKAPTGDATEQAATESTAVYLKPVEEPSVTVHGPRNLAHLLATGRRFILRQGMQVHVDEVHEGPVQDSGRMGSKRVGSRDGETDADAGTDAGAAPPLRDMSRPTWSDENIKVWAMTISPQEPARNPGQGESKSVKKRSHHEFAGEGAGDAEGDREEMALPGSISAPPDESAKANGARDDQLRQDIVTQMFGSSWRRDEFVEMPLSAVQLPAAIFVRNSETGAFEKYQAPLNGEGKHDHQSGAAPADMRVWVRKPWPASTVEWLPTAKPSNQSLCYIVKTHPSRGKFSPERAQALKVKPGPNYRLLTEGKSVTATDGTVVTPDMVLGEGRVGEGIAIVELPTRAYVNDLVNREEWRTKAVMEGVGVILWILGPGVIHSEDLLRFMKKMTDRKHMVSSPDNCSNYLAFVSAATATMRLNLIDPDRFQMPVHDNTPRLLRDQASRMVYQDAERGLTIQLEPCLKFESDSIVPTLDPGKMSNQVPPNVVRLSGHARKLLARKDVLRQLNESQRDLPGKDAEIVTLGTGSMLPSKYRNVSATLVRVPGYGSYLFDCGENTLGQLRRVFAAAEVAEILRDLKGIWISHLHADHHLGTVSVIKAWYQEVTRDMAPSGTDGCSGQPTREQLMEFLRRGPRLFVMSGVHMIRWLKEYSDLEDYGYQMVVPITVKGVSSQATDLRTSLTWNGVEVGFGRGDQELEAAMTTALGVTDLQAARVDHCHGAHAVSITFADGFKFSYSGDCRPSKLFARIGRGSTVLLHEATFDDELRRDAIGKKHSTTSEALAVGMAMGARRVLLTHFSQRYQKIPVLEKVEEPWEVKRKQQPQPQQQQQEEEELPSLETENVPNDDDGDHPDMPIADLDHLPFTSPSSSSSSSSSSQPGLATATSTSTSTSKSTTTAAAAAAAAAVVVKIRQNPPRNNNSNKNGGAAGARDMKIGVGFDYMRVKVGQIAHLERFTPALMTLFGGGGGGSGGAK